MTSPGIVASAFAKALANFHARVGNAPRAQAWSDAANASPALWRHGALGGGALSYARAPGEVELAESVGALPPRSGLVDDAGGRRWKFRLSGELLAPLDLAAIPPDIRRVELDFSDAQGGDVLAATRTLQDLTERGFEVSSVVRGMAASAHALLAILHCGRRIIAPDGRLLMHSTRRVVFGSPSELRAEAETLEALNSLIVSALAARTGQSHSTVEGWMIGSTETVFDSSAAVAVGLADALVR